MTPASHLTSCRLAVTCTLECFLLLKDFKSVEMPGFALLTERYFLIQTKMPSFFLLAPLPHFSRTKQTLPMTEDTTESFLYFVFCVPTVERKLHATVA